MGMSILIAYSHLLLAITHSPFLSYLCAMKYQLGDIVLILHSDEEGQIVDFINDKMVMVDVKGVKFPVYLDQIDFPYFKRFSEKKIVQDPKQKKYIDDVKKEKASNVERVADGVWLTFLPVMDIDEFGDTVVEELKVHLVNRTEMGYNFIYPTTSWKNIEFENLLMNDFKVEPNKLITTSIVILK